MTSKNLPLGVQNFDQMIESDYVFVDKTDLVHKLVTSKDYYFLSRPRGFGKSLLLSTVKSYFEGKKELFKGLKIESLEKQWKSYPVLKFDLNGVDTKAREGIPFRLLSQLEAYENKYETTRRFSYCNGYRDYVIRFRRLIKDAYEQTGSEVVILMDEFEKPILDSCHDPELQNWHRDYLKPFYSILKSMEEYIRFVLITGVSPIGQLSVFSDLNNVLNITQDPEFATICGFIEEEITQNFSSFISELCEKQGWEYGQALDALRNKYGGYKFSEEDIKVYNPLSLLNCLQSNELRNF